MALRTFTVFDREHSAQDTIPLLGRVVLDPRRPFDAFIPEMSPDHKSLEGPERPSGFLENHEVKVTTETNAKIEASTLRSAEARTRLTKVFSLGAKLQSNVTYDLSSGKIKTLSLSQHELIFRDVSRDYTDMIKALLKSHGNRLYLMVTLKTALDPEVKRVVENERAGEFQALPIDVAAGNPLPASMGGLNVQGTVKVSRSSAIEATADGEIAFAAEYCEIVETRGLEFGLKPPVRSVKKTKVKKVSRWGGRHLAFGDSDDDDDISDDEEEHEEVGDVDVYE